jgi:3-dehydrotetronate 4-kinase
MTLALGSIADDYTGASDLANTLTRCGLRTIQTVGVPADDIALPEVDAVVVALKSRSIAARQAVGLARAADDWLRERGASHVMFKICSTFDSTDAGNIGPVTDALRAGEIVLVTPAFPETRAYRLPGQSVRRFRAAQRKSAQRPSLNPMRDANLVRVLANQSRCRIGLVDLAVVAAGVDAVGKCLAGTCRRRHRGGDRHLSKFGVDTAHVLCHSIDMRRALRKRRTCAPSRASSLSDRERLSAW